MEYSKAKGNSILSEQIQRFKKACSQIDSSLTSDEQLKMLSRVIEDFVPDNHISIKNNSEKI